MGQKAISIRDDDENDEKNLREAEHLESDYLRVGDLQIDLNYQRMLSMPKLKALKEEWDIKRCDDLRISQRIGTTNYYIFDGQHRWEAAKQLFGEDYLLPCRIERLTQQEEAQRFAKQHENEFRVARRDQFLALLFAQEASIMDIDRIVHETGWQFGHEVSSGNVTQPGVLHAYFALMKWYRIAGPNTLARSLRLLKQIWPELPEAGDARSIETMTRFLHMYGDRARDFVIINHLSRTTPRTIIQKSMDLHYGRTVGMTVVMVDLYNKGLKGTKRLPNVDRH
jgi:hypothetical protein